MEADGASLFPTRSLAEAHLEEWKRAHKYDAKVVRSKPSKDVSVQKIQPASNAGHALGAKPGAGARSRLLQADESDELPRGSFGAGGWAPGGKGCYPRMSQQEAAEARRAVRQMLLAKYKGMSRAWRDLDINGDGRLSFLEFCRACHKLGVGYCPRQLWDAFDMDRNSFVTLDEVDPKFSELLGGLASTILNTYATIEEAWHSCFNRRGSGRVDFEYFSRACSQVGFDGDCGAAFDALSADKATTGICWREFDLLQLWSGQEPPTYASPLTGAAAADAVARGDDKKDMVHVLKSQADQRARVKEAAKAAAKAAKAKPRQTLVPNEPLSALDEFKELLLKSYGNFVCAWRQGLDYDHNGYLDYNELQKACKNVGYAGNRKALWYQLDLEASGIVSLEELDKEVAQMLKDITGLAIKHHDSWEGAWRGVFDVRGGGRVERQGFVDGCQKLGLQGCPASADRLFELLDMDRVRYLTFAGTCWLDGIEEVQAGPERECHGDMVVSGAYKGMTRSQQRKLEDMARDNRLREARFEARTRSELAIAGGASLSPARSEPSLLRPRRTSHREGCIFPTSYIAQRVPLAQMTSAQKANAPSKSGGPALPTLSVADRKHEKVQELIQLMRPLEPNVPVSAPHLNRWHTQPLSGSVAGGPRDGSEC